MIGVAVLLNAAIRRPNKSRDAVLLVHRHFLVGLVHYPVVVEMRWWLAAVAVPSWVVVESGEDLGTHRHVGTPKRTPGQARHSSHLPTHVCRLGIQLHRRRQQ